MVEMVHCPQTGRLLTQALSLCIFQKSGIDGRILFDWVAVEGEVGDMVDIGFLHAYGADDEVDKHAEGEKEGDHGDDHVPGFKGEAVEHLSSEVG
jgi:hypothetical protein